MLPSPSSSKYQQTVLDPRQSLQNPQKYVGKERFIRIMSSWELSFVKYLDKNENVLEWSSESVSIVYKSPLDSRMHRYFPDFSVKFKNAKGEIKEAIIEIKPDDQTEPPKLTEKQQTKTKIRLVSQYAVNDAKWKAAEDYCRKRNILFKILTEKDFYFNG
jgi:hypothetical protein